MNWAQLIPLTFWSFISFSLLVLFVATVFLGLPLRLFPTPVYKTRLAYYRFRGFRVVPFGYVPIAR